MAVCSALLAVLVTPSDGVADWIAAGQAAGAATATAAGLQASFLNQPVEIPSMHLQLARRLDLPGPPQLLLRFGYGPSSGPTPRRPIEEVLVARRPN